MVRTYSIGSGKKVLVVVIIAALLLVAGGAALSMWSAGQMRETVNRQFNEEQLVIARNVANLIERELKVLKREILLVVSQMGYWQLAVLLQKNLRLQMSSSQNIISNKKLENVSRSHSGLLFSYSCLFYQFVFLIHLSCF